MKIHRLALSVLCCLGISSWAGAQEASEILPAIQNRLKDSLLSTAQADSSVAPASGAGKTGAPGFQVIASGVGYSFSAASPDFNYGDEITPPLEDVDGGPLTLAEARDYWRTEPARPGETIQIGGDIGAIPVDAGTNERYYYSPHAERIFATQTGNITLKWVKAQPDENNNFTTFEPSYTIGFGTSLTSRNLYWTEVDFEAPRVQIPTGIVQDLAFLYSDRFPETVDVADRVIPGGVNEQLVPDTTLWFDRNLDMIRAYNVEGRVIIEYLGDPRGKTGDELREHLGLEIVEVRKELTPVTVESVIGEQLFPSSSPGVILNDLDYSPMQISAPGPLVAQHFVANRTVYYGIEENLQAPRVEFYWLEEGSHTILWPELRNNYRIEWPDDVSDFAGVFARPDLGSAEDVLAGSYLNLLATNTPELIFQDDPTSGEASLNFQFHLSVELDEFGDEVNRSLIRFNSGNDFWYVRLYSATTAHLQSIDAVGEFDSENPLDFHITQSASVGRRLEPPHESLSLGGYIDPISGDAYSSEAYIDPFAEGGIDGANQGAIIPVNARSGNDELRVWWFRKLAPSVAQADLFKSVFIPTVIADYTISYPTAAPEIIMASNAGTGDLSPEQVSGEIYYQNDPAQTGYNPNEEHAVMIAGRAYALRDDLNTPDVTSDPFVLISHDDVDGRPDMTVFKVLRENETHTFDYPAVAGILLQAPLPLPIIPQPIVDGSSRNIEVTPDNLDPVLNGPSAENLTYYDNFTFQDRKGATWVYRGPHQPGVEPEKKLSMRYYYPTLETFAFPNAATGLDEAPDIGTIVPYLRPVGASDSPVTGTPLTITFTPQWPEESPILHFGETLAKPKFGLPQILGQSSVELVYQQSIAVDFTTAQNSVVLHDSTINRSVNLSLFSEINELPGSVATVSSRGKIFFQNLPSHLEGRIFFDGLVGTQGAIIFQGRFNDELAGEDYLSPNTFSPADIVTLKALCLPNDSLKVGWDQLIDNLKVIPTFRVLDDRQLEESITYAAWLERKGITQVIGQNTKAIYGPTELPQIASPDQAVNGYFLSAIGGGSGFVTLITGNGLVNSEVGEPIQMHVFRVGEQLYRGELKPLVAANPLSEKVAVQHTGDFAGDPDSYEFQWRKAPPVDSLAPPAFLFENVTLGGALASPEISRNGFTVANVIPFSAAIYEAGADRTVPGLSLTGTLDFTPQLTDGDRLSKVFFSVKLAGGDGVIVNLNGTEALRYDALSGENSETSPEIPADLQAFLTNGDDFVVFELPARSFTDGPNRVEVLYTTPKADGVTSTIDFRVAIQVKEDQSSNYFLFATEVGKNRHIVSGAGIDTLGDNYYIMRYRPTDPEHPMFNVWSEWTNPALVEGWIKRVLAGINPFNQRVSDFFENAVDTNVSIVSQAGSRWEGDIALNLEAVQDTGLIEIYETVLKRGMNLSINGTPSVDYGPANDALLLAAGYLNDLYVALGNEAFADAANPMVHFDSQALGTLGDAASTQGFEETFRSTSTARFSFQGQVPSLLDEELSLLRGRDDLLSPSIQTSPVYNRLFWNYTRGIDAGELIYALNYNITEQSDDVADGKIDAADAARMFPQAHGDAYGHYLTAVKNYYRLLTDAEFTWGTRAEAVNVLGQPVSIDYFDERKFAASASALTRTASQIISLERRKAFQEGADGWSNLSDGRPNPRTGTTRYWGVDDWTARGAQGAYFHWLVGNAILPEEDLVHEGIQKIDRTTVPELDAIAKASEQIQRQLQAADARVNPLDLSENSLLFDISPSELVAGETHFEQIFKRATAALGNANAVFERATDSTRLLRSTENQSQNLTQIIGDEESAFIGQLIDIFGQAYPGDMGPGKVYPQDYSGPDLVRYMAIDRVFDIFAKEDLFSYSTVTHEHQFELNVTDSAVGDALNAYILANIGLDSLNVSTLTSLVSGVPSFNFSPLISVADNVENSKTVTYILREDQGPYLIAEPALGKRPSLGSIQTALNEVRFAEEQLYVGLAAMDGDRESLVETLRELEIEMQERLALQILTTAFSTLKFTFTELVTAIDNLLESLALVEKTKQQIVGNAVQALPIVVGVSNDVSAPARAALLAADVASQVPLTVAEIAGKQARSVATFVFILAEKVVELAVLTNAERIYLREQISNIETLYGESRARTREVDALAVAYSRALEKYRTEFSKGQGVLADREVFRRRAAAAIQGYRTRDIAFRTFRTEALEEYQTLLDWASKYTFLAAQAYDYETGLLGSSDGQAFLGEIISSRALGVVGPGGQPALSASSSGDPGLSGLLAKLKGDYDVVKGRLGFNNPETNGTTFSLRREYFRIPDGPEGDIAWQQKLESLVTKNLLIDADIAAHAMQLAGDAAQPGFLIEFPTAIVAGRNFFGKDLIAGDNDFSTTNFATKISSVGVVLEGYQGMVPCLICQGGGGDPTHNHDDALSATPDLYLIPTGLDTMRTPPLGDGQAIRTWFVQDYAMPLPFDLGSVEPTSDATQQTTDSLRASFRSPRRHPAFRATDRADFFYTGFAADYTSSRLVGRSVWNSNWKLAIPAKELLANEADGIAKFIRTVKDIKIHLKTYSYSGN
jgi:hypothetical protein